jgi:transposase InsO family protein
VSLSSVKRTLDRKGLLAKRSPWKRYHAPTPRPTVAKPGDLVQLDTIHLMVGTKRIYVFTLLDVYSRWAFARAYDHATTASALDFLKRARKSAPFQFLHLQSDHGSEFSTNFTEQTGLPHRHSRVRTPNDNAHLERFNRTIQDECLDDLPRDVSVINHALPKYLRFYNTRRFHFGINLLIPIQLIPSY